jgi:UDP-N-acetylglucosamine acyltransferase
MAGLVHPSAVVDPDARLARDASVGPLCHVGPGVTLGSGTELVGHVTVVGPTVLGRGNRVYPGAVLGAPPQDLSHRGEPTTLVIGDENEIRENVTVHRGTRKGGGETRIGSSCLLMVGSHVAHDCQVGDRVILTNNTSLGGHVIVEDGVVCGGHVAVAPFVRLGTLCFVAGGSMVERPVPPYVVAAGDRARVRALNRVGLERAGVSGPSVAALRDAFVRLFRGTAPIAVGARALSNADDPHVRRLARFILSAQS